MVGIDHQRVIWLFNNNLWRKKFIWFAKLHHLRIRAFRFIFVASLVCSLGCISFLIYFFDIPIDIWTVLLGFFFSFLVRPVFEVGLMWTIKMEKNIKNG